MNYKKKIVGLLIVIILIAVLPVLIMVTRRVAELRSRAAGSGSMVLTGPATASPGQGFDVIISVNSGGSSIKSRGVDVMLQFPTDKLTLNSIVANAASSTPATALRTFVPVSSTTPYDFDTATVIAAANAGSPLGTISFGAAPVIKTSPLPPAPTPPFQPNSTDSFSGSIPTLATLHFTVKTGASGQANINFVPSTISSTSNGINDSNIASYDLTNDVATDLLGSVTNLTVTIGGTATNTPTPTNTPIPTNTPTTTPTTPPGATNTPTPTPDTSCSKGTLGDLNCDGIINIFDLNFMLTHWSWDNAQGTPIPTPTFTAGQVNFKSPNIAGNDGKTNVFDLNKLLSNWSWN